MGIGEAVAANNLVTPFARRHGQYEVSTVVDLDGSLGGKRNSMVEVMLNRGGTAVERWMANDGAELFGESERRAIRYVQALWVRAEGQLRAVDYAAVAVSGDETDGMSQHAALNDLSESKEKVPARYWTVFENVCRFDEPAGTAGSRLATNSRSALDAAKTTVAYTAGLIAIWRRL